MTTLLPSYYTLRFNDYDHARAVCRALGYWREASDDAPEGPIENGQIRGADGLRGFTIFVIGQDPIAPATYDEAGNEISPAVQLTGYYVNVAGLLPQAAEQFQVPYGTAGDRFYELG